MNRRAYLAGVGAGTVALAGCLDSSRLGGDSPRSATFDDTVTASPGQRTRNLQAQFRDVSLPVPRDDLDRGAEKDGIPAITDPVFGPDWSAAEQSLTLADSDRVIGVARDGEARAYPLRILDRHEIVNDGFDGPLLVTYCPLCGSGMTAVRNVDGETTTFGVSGLLFRSDLVMYDRATESLWSQIMATAIRGPQTGESLQLVPSSLTSWSEWRGTHPDTEVLLPPPKSGTIVDARPRRYGVEAYAGYDSSSQIGIGRAENPDDRLHPKTTVLGIAKGSVSRAYPLERVQATGVINDTVGDLPVVVAATDDGALVSYVRRIGGEVVTFERDGAFLRAAGSRFRLTDGVAVSGPHEGMRLDQANGISPKFWFAWASFHPETEIWSPSS